MTGTFKFDPTTETFVFRVDGRDASVSWNSKSRKFEIWATAPSPFKTPQQIPTPRYGGLFRTLLALYRVTHPVKASATDDDTSLTPEHENAYDRRERDSVRFEGRDGRMEGVDR